MDGARGQSRVVFLAVRLSSSCVRPVWVGWILSGVGARRLACPGVRVADDLGQRQFRPDAPNLLWVADITYLRSREGWL